MTLKKLTPVKEDYHHRWNRGITMIKDLIKLEAGTTLKIEITITCEKDKYYTEKSLNEFITEMAKYYFSGDPTIIYKYFKQDYILDHNI